MSYPILYSPTETNFNHNGLGILGDCAACEVVEEANGIFELSLVYPMDGIHYEAITDRAIIKSKPDQFREPQLFRIYSISKPMSGMVSVSAAHISYDLSGIPVSPFKASNVGLALEGLKSNAATECPFEFWTDKSTAASFAVNAPASIRSKLGGTEGSILDVFGGEYEFDNFTVKLHNSRGLNRGVSIRYGKNLTDIRQDQNCDAVATGIYPYWFGNVDGNTDLVELPEKIIYVPGEHEFQRVKTVDFTSDFETKPTAEQLRARAQAYIAANNIGVPVVSLSVSFAQLEQTEEYRHLNLLERVSLFDEVNVQFPALKVSTTAKAVKLVYDVLADRVKKVELGTIKSNIADTVASQNAEIEKGKDKPTLSVVQKVSSALTKEILGQSGGEIRLIDTDDSGSPDELYIADDADPNLAVKVWRFNKTGWAASKNGYYGPFEMGATLEDGLLANFVTAAHLVAGTIKSSDDGKTFYLDLDTGTLSLDGSAGGGVNIKNAGVVVTKSQTFNALDYSNEDVSKIQSILFGEIEATAADIQKYDIYGSGDIELIDLVACQKIVLSGENLTVRWNAQLDTSKANILKIWRKNSGADDTEDVIFNATAGGVQLQMASPLDISNGGTGGGSLNEARESLGFGKNAEAAFVVQANQEVEFSLNDGEVAYIGYTTGSRSNKNIYFLLNGTDPTNASYSYTGSSGVLTNGIFAHAGSNNAYAGTFTGWLAVHGGVVELWGCGRRNDGTRGDVYMAWNTDRVEGITISESGTLALLKLS